VLRALLFVAERKREKLRFIELRTIYADLYKVLEVSLFAEIFKMEHPDLIVSLYNNGTF
jgi:hypothetical protein